MCHVNVSSNKILGKAVFLLQPPLKVLLPKYPYINGHYDRPHYRVSIDGRLIEVSFILTRYMNTAVGHDGNTIARFTLAIQHTRCSTRTGTRLVRDRNPVFQNQHLFINVPTNYFHFNYYFTTRSARMQTACWKKLRADRIQEMPATIRYGIVI